MEKIKAFLLRRFPPHSFPRIARLIARLTWTTLFVILVVKALQVAAVTYLGGSLLDCR